MNRILITILISLLPYMANGQFQANMLNVISGKELQYKVYSDLNHYRYDFEADGMKGVVIVMPDENKTFILVPDKKFVHKTTCDALMSRMNDPVQSYLWFKKNGTEKAAGVESISGESCRKSEVYMQDQKVFTVWYSDKLRFPLKIVNYTAENTTMQLTNISSWNVDREMFSVPDDYAEVDEQMQPVIAEPSPPEKWTVIEETIPYEGNLSTGTKIKLPVTSDVYHKVELKNNTQDMAKVISHLFRDGKELPDEEQGPVSYRSKRLHPGENKTNTYAWKPGDVVIIEVYEGIMTLKVYLEK